MQSARLHTRIAMGCYAAQDAGKPRNGLPSVAGLRALDVYSGASATCTPSDEVSSQPRLEGHASMPIIRRLAPWTPVRVQALRDFTRNAVAPELDQLDVLRERVHDLEAQLADLAAIVDDPRARKRARIRRLYRQGFSHAFIAKEVGVSKPAVRRNARDLPAPASSVGVDGVVRRVASANGNGSALSEAADPLEHSAPSQMQLLHGHARAPWPDVSACPRERCRPLAERRPARHNPCHDATRRAEPSTCGNPDRRTGGWRRRVRPRRPPVARARPGRQSSRR